MAKFIVLENREIIKGFYTQSYEVEANSFDEAIEKVANIEQNYDDVEYLDQDFDIRDSEFIEYEEN